MVNLVLVGHLHKPVSRQHWDLLCLSVKKSIPQNGDAGAEPKKQSTWSVDQEKPTRVIVSFESKESAEVLWRLKVVWEGPKSGRAYNRVSMIRRALYSSIQDDGDYLFQEVIGRWKSSPDRSTSA